MLRKAKTNYILNLLNLRPVVMEISVIYNVYYKRLHKLWIIMVNIVCHYDPNYGTITINCG